LHGTPEYFTAAYLPNVTDFYENSVFAFSTMHHLNSINSRGIHNVVQINSEIIRECYFAVFSRIDIVLAERNSVCQLCFAQ